MMTQGETRKPFTLSELLQDQLDFDVQADCSITGLALDSRLVKAGDLFLACRGLRVNGSEYIDQAIERGARAVLWETEPGVEAIPLAWRSSSGGRRVPVIAAPALSQLVGVLADQFYGQPSQALFMTGITGTNGKTTCALLLAQALNVDAPAGVIGTLGTGLVGALDTTSHTTPDAVRCQALLAEMRAAGAASVVMEVSSHALDQGRVNGIAFDCAVFTNLTHEHLDYHGDMQHYGAAKQRLFGTPDLHFAVLNMDDQFGRELFETLPARLTTLSYGLEEHMPRADIQGHIEHLDAQGICMQVHTPQGTGVLKAPLLGRFNASNLLAVLGVLLLRGIDLQDALQRLSRITPVPGRMQRIGGDTQALIVVDFAHTPDALEQALRALREHAHGKLWCVFGCGGDRDRAKRGVMGALAEQLADYVVLTDDNPRSEASLSIIEEITQGMQHADAAYIQADRRKAIAFALQRAAPEDVVLIAGKGHETFQEVQGQRLPFSDMAVVQELLGGRQ